MSKHIALKKESGKTARPCRLEHCYIFIYLKQF